MLKILATSLIMVMLVACAISPPTDTKLPSLEPQVTATASHTATPLLIATAIPAPSYTVCAAGCDFTTIQAAIDDPGTAPGDIIGVTDAVHTEAGIVVNKSVTIQGRGADSTAVQAHATTDSATDRVFLIANGATVTIRALTIRHGNPISDPDSGGGITNEGTLTLQNSIVSDNTSNAGGGILNVGTLTLVNCTVRDNAAVKSGDYMQKCGNGGGIKNMAGTLTLINSTVSGNSAQKNGGGVFVSCDGTLELINSTVSGNSAGGNGGGIYIKGAVELVNSTISDNSAAVNGGGVYAEGSGEQGVPRGLLNYSNTIIASNRCGLEKYGTADCLIGDYGTIGTNTNNLVGDNSCSPDYSGDPMLGTLADNGGDTQTHALLPGSPAIDAISVLSCTLTTDQRGAPRPVALSSSDTPCDIGAFEAQTLDTTTVSGMAVQSPGHHHMALGYAGQFIFVVPEKALVGAFTSDLSESDFYVPQTLLAEAVGADSADVDCQGYVRGLGRVLLVQEHFPRATPPARRADDASLLHQINQPRRPRVADAQPPLEQRD
jgi:predicted outer membrane repeat protein